MTGCNGHGLVWWVKWAWLGGIGEVDMAGCVRGVGVIGCVGGVGVVGCDKRS